MRRGCVVRSGRLIALVAMTACASSVVVPRLTVIPGVVHVTVILFHEAGHVLSGLSASYSTVTLFARFRGLSTSVPRATAV